MGGADVQLGVRCTGARAYNTGHDVLTLCVPHRAGLQYQREPRRDGKPRCLLGAAHPTSTSQRDFNTLCISSPLPSSMLYNEESTLT